MAFVSSGPLAACLLACAVAALGCAAPTRARAEDAHSAERAGDHPTRTASAGPWERTTDVAAGLGVVHLHIESDAPITRLMGAETCPEPCDRAIDGRAGRRFYFAPREAPESERFDLSQWSGPVTARVSAGSDLRQKGGYVVIGLGGFAVLNGLEGVVTGGIVRGFANEQETKDVGKTFQVVGLVTAAVGVVVGLAGLGLALSGDTTYQLSPTPRSGISQRTSAPR